MQLSYAVIMEILPPRHRSPVHVANCNLAASFDFLGDRWSLLIVRSALFGIRRFEDFRTELSIPRNILSARLKRLVDNGILIRRDYRVAGSRPRPEYFLTEMGEALRLPFLAMRQWADHWIGEDLSTAITLFRQADRLPVRIGYVDALNRPVPDEELGFDIADWAPEPR